MTICMCVLRQIDVLSIYESIQRRATESSDGGSMHASQSWALAVFFGFLKIQSTHFFQTYSCASPIYKTYPQSN